ncbi:MAG TPA: DEAD/DEAH box helicase [Acidobacteriota bacterium]|nr:DEAD/DEAH box helicase [Acidobacteriota bacterium]
MNDNQTKHSPSTPSSQEPQEPELAEVSMEDLPKELQDAAHKAGWSALMPVQKRAIPYLLQGRDLMVQSRTGSGKTGAFLLPLLQRIDPSHDVTQAMVLTPTRELAAQVARESERLSSQGSNVRTVVVYGGVGYGAQMKGLKAGAHLIVGTPGRILDHLERGTMRLNKLRYMIFDEADRLMSMGFFPDMKRLQKHLPEKRHTYMFSATYPPSVLSLANMFLDSPERLNLSRDTLHVVDTEHLYYVVDSMDKDRALIRLIEMENPESAIIFCNRKSTVEYVTQVLQRFGYHADMLMSDLSQKARERVLGRLRDKTLTFLVATDVAARGIDIDRLSHVIQYDFPEEVENYIHRAGRTGRAGAVGMAATLASHAEELNLKKAAKQLGIPLESRPLPGDSDVEQIVSERATALLEADLRSRDNLQRERLQRMVPLADSLSESDEEKLLIAMLLDDYYQKKLHQPETWTGTIEQPERTQSSRRKGGSGGRGRRKGGGGRGGKGRGRRGRGRKS